MTDFLLNCRVFEILPPTKNRNRLSYNFVAKEDTGGPKCKSKKATVKKDGSFNERVVDKIDFTIQLLYSSMEDKHNLSFTRVRMDSVKRNKEKHTLQPKSMLAPEINEVNFQSPIVDRTPNDKDLHTSRIVTPAKRKRNISMGVDSLATLPAAINIGKKARNLCFEADERTINQRSMTNDFCHGGSFGSCNENRQTHFMDDYDEESVDKSENATSVESVNEESTRLTPQFTFHSAPVMGLHLPQSFKNRIWRNLKLLRLGYELFLFLFKDAFKRSTLYVDSGLSVNDRTMQLLIRATVQRKTAHLYMEFLAHLCIMFKEVDSMTSDHCKTFMGTSMSGRTSREMQ